MLVAKIHNHFETNKSFVSARLARRNNFGIRILFFNFASIKEYAPCHRLTAGRSIPNKGMRDADCGIAACICIGGPPTECTQDALFMESLYIFYYAMKEFNYINSIKAYDSEYHRILNENVKEVWHTEDNKPDFIINILDDLDYIEHNRLDDRTDEVECYLYINILNIKVIDIMRFAELIGVDVKTMEVYYTEESEYTVHYFSDHIDYTTLYWTDTVIHPLNKCN